MLVLFPANPVDPATVDETFAREAAAATAAGFDTAVVNVDALEQARVEPALRRLGARQGRAVYRGWMMRPRVYTRFHAALAERGVQLLNDPAQYRHAHYLPECYPVIAAHAPEMVSLRLPVGFTGAWLQEQLATLLAPFGAAPLVLKDFVKSQKHAWKEACFIPDASDAAGVMRVVTRFLELQEDGLNEGLVFRRFIPLAPAGTHPRSGMPLGVEYRLFFLDGQLLSLFPLWDEATVTTPAPVPAEFAGIARQVQSRFFSMDVALAAAGGWVILELGDGGVSGLNDRTDVAGFYRALAAGMPPAAAP